MRRFVTTVIGMACVLCAMPACSLNDLVQARQPANTIGRDGPASEAGAIALARSAVTQFSIALNGSSSMQGVASYVTVSGLLTDEFQRANYSIGIGFDLRSSENDQSYELSVEAMYANMQYARITAQLARQALATYTSSVPAFYRTQVTALEAYAILHLAELFCSGTPLSAVSIENDIAYRAGSTTAEMYEQAIVLLDSVIAADPDSTRLLNLARVGKGRALLGLGRFADAAAAVAAVPNGFVYNAEHNIQIPGMSNHLGRTLASPVVHVAEKEGGNGMNWVTARDPRVSLVAFSASYKTDKYATAAAPTPLASAVEARLIEAEAAIQADAPSWLSTVNALRTNGMTLGAGCPTGIAPPCAAPGTGGVAGLPNLPDAATKEERINTLFRERAFWLFATGHRQGDLRRLVRVYQRPEATVYPVGLHSNAITPTGLLQIIGSTIVMRPSRAEIESNPRYTGCFNLNQ